MHPEQRCTGDEEGERLLGAGGDREVKEAKFDLLHNSALSSLRRGVAVATASGQFIFISSKELLKNFSQTF